MENCRWAPLLGSALEKRNEELIALTKNEQVTRGKELLDILKGAKCSASSNTPFQTARGRRIVGEDWRVVVKQTFIEVLIPPEARSLRRSLSDSALTRFQPDSEKPWKSLAGGKLHEDMSDASTNASLDAEDIDGKLGETLATDDNCFSSDDEKDKDVRSRLILDQCVEQCWTPSGSRSLESPSKLSPSSMSHQWSNQNMGAECNVGLAGALCQEWRTTVMIRNMPNNYTQGMLMELVDSMGFAGCYDFIYLPIDFKTQAGLGYAFINFVSVAQAMQCFDQFEGFSGWRVPSDKVCSVTWSTPTQGFEEHVERYRNSPVMHPSLPEEWKPALFQHGVRVAFPPPTKQIKSPKIRQQPLLKGAEREFY